MKKQIRNSVKSALEAFPDFNKVQIGRRQPVNMDRHLPAVIIFTDAEQSSRITCRPVTLEHSLSLKLEFFVKPSGISAGEDDLDMLISEADDAILPAIRQTSGISDIRIDSLDFNADSDPSVDVLVATRSYIVTYQTLQP